MVGEKTIDRRQRLVAERERFARRLEPAEQGRQQRNAGGKCDQHAEAGNQAEFGDALVNRRQERQKAGRRRQGRERERRAGAPARLDERLAHIVDLVPLGAIADAELQSEVDAEPHEQHGKIHRYQIERADHQQTERGGDRQPDGKAGEYRDNDARPAQSEPQDDEHDRNRYGGVQRGILLDRGELLVRHRHRAGQTQARLVLSREIEVASRLADGVGRPLSRFQFGIVERRPDLEETKPLIRRRGAALDQLVPGKARRLPRIHFLDRIGGERHWPRHVVERDLAALHAEQSKLQDLDDAAQRRISRQHLHQALRLGQHFHLRTEIGHRFEQQTVPREKTAALGFVDGVKQILLLRQVPHQCTGRFIDQFGRRRVEHRDDQFVLREGLFEGGFALPPRNVRGI